MNERVLSQQLPNFTGEEVTLAGWVRRIRSVGADLAFVIVLSKQEF